MRVSEIASLNFVVENVEFSPGSGRAVLHSSDGRTLTIDLEGDCCSSSFFDYEARLDLRDILGHKLVRIEDGAFPDGVTPAPDYPNSDSTSNHCLLITTDKASLSVLWRNESNGYYDGCAELSLDGERLDRY